MHRPTRSGKAPRPRGDMRPASLRRRRRNRSIPLPLHFCAFTSSSNNSWTPTGFSTRGECTPGFDATATMQTNLSEHAKTLARADEAESILRSCVHCGFCNATCPTYQILGNELDGPRGRIYLIKQLLEGEPVTGKTQLHLDRCLSCRNCETTCPSGVSYHALLDIGRAELEHRVERPTSQRLLREVLRHVVPRPAVFNALLKAWRTFRPLLPDAMKRKCPAPVVAPEPLPAPR